MSDENVELIVRIASGGIGQTVKDVLKLRGTLTGIGDEAVKASAKAQKAAEEIGKRYKLTADQVEALAKRLDSLDFTIDKEGKLRDAQGRFIKIRDEVEKVGGGLDDLAKSAKNAEGGITALGIAIQTKLIDIAVDGFRLLGEAINETLNAAISENADFEQASAAAATLVDDVDALTAALGEQQRNLGGQVTTNELLAASYNVLSAGFTEAGLAAEITGEAARGAISGFSDVGTVTDAVTTILNSYSDANLTAAEVVDQLVQTQNLGKITVDQYAASIGRAASIASTAGVDFEELNAIVAAATAAGVAPESAVSGARQAIINLLKPTEDAKQILGEFGIANAQAALKANGLVGVLQILAEQDPTGELLSKIFTDVDALAAIAPVAGQNIDKLNAALQGIGNSTGVTDSNIEKLTQTIPALQKEVQTLVSEGLLEFGQAIAPITAGVLEFIAAVGTAAGAGFDGFDELAEAGERLRLALTENPELVERLGAALATLANEGVSQLAQIVDQITVLVSNQEAVDSFAESIENVAVTIRALGEVTQFIIALGEGFLVATQGINEFGEQVPIALNAILPGFGTLFDIVTNLEERVEGLRQKLADLGVIELPEPTKFESTASAIEATATALDAFNQASSAVGAEAQQQIEQTADSTEQSAERIEGAVDTITDKYQQLASEADLATQNLIASQLEQGASAEEIAGIEAKALNDRVALNRQKLAELRAINQDSLGAEEAEALGDEIIAVETAIAKDRVTVAQQQADERERIEKEAAKRREEIAKAEADAIKAAREEAAQAAEEAFGDSETDIARRNEDQLGDLKEAQEKALNQIREDGQQRIEDFKEQSEIDLQNYKERRETAFQKRQQEAARNFQKELEAERDRESSRIDAAASEAEFQTALRLAESPEDRQALIDAREQAQERAKILAEEEAKALRTVREGEDLTPIEQARADLEERIAAKQQAFQDAQQLEKEEFETALEADLFAIKAENERALGEIEKQVNDEIAAAEKFAAQQIIDLERNWEDEKLQRERDFKAEQRRLDEASAQRIEQILERARGGGIDGARRDGGPVRAGGTYLVGEEGPELITPTRGGYVHTARETAAMMQATRMPTAPAIVGADNRGIERRLEQLISLVEANRQVQAQANYQIVNQNAPADPVEMELRRVSGLARRSGLG